MGWEIVPEVLTQHLVRLTRDYMPPPMIITENGMANADVVTADGAVEDTPRVAYLQGHLDAVAKAIAMGVDVRGYFYWSLLDNFEWDSGYAKRFGLFRVDYATQARTPKASAHWYRAFIAQHKGEPLMAELQLQGLRRTYANGVTAVDGIDLTVAEGEFMVLVGPSGCGKSTTLRMIAGLEEMSAGRMLIGGVDVTDTPPAERGVAMVFQSYALYPHMTVAENMGFALKIAGRPRRDIEAAVRRAAEIAAARALARSQAARAVGRPAPARRDRARDRARAQGVPVRRAAVQPRRVAAHADAARDGAAARAAGRDHRLRHARPGRGDDAGRPHRRDQRRPHRAGRARRRPSIASRSTASSPASSARRR
jgi:hypothetical protein